MAKRIPTSKNEAKEQERLRIKEGIEHMGVGLTGMLMSLVRLTATATDLLERLESLN